MSLGRKKPKQSTRRHAPRNVSDKAELSQADDGLVYIHNKITTAKKSAQDEQLTWQDAQRQDKVLGPAMAALEGTDKGATKWTSAYELREGLLWKIEHYRDARRHLETYRRLAVPAASRQAVMDACHTVGTAGHPGVVRTYRIAKARFYWPGMFADVKRYVQQCPKCQLHGKMPSRAPIKGHVTATAPGEKWQVDTLHLPTSKRGYSCALVAVDVFSRFVVMMPWQGSPNSWAASAILLERIIGGPGGVPAEVITDGGPEFHDLFEKLCKDVGVKHHRSSAGHSQGHGIVERANATLSSTIAKHLHDDPKEWDLYVGWAQLLHNATPHPALSEGNIACVSPAEVFLGRKLHTQLDRQLDLPVNLSEGDPQEQAAAMSEYAAKVKTFVEAANRKYNQQLKDSSRERRRKLQDIKVGDLVAMVKKPREKKLAKTMPNWKGPYKVMRIASDGVTYELKHTGAATRAKTVHKHVDFIKPWRQGKARDGAKESILPAPSGDRAYEVEQIVAERQAPGGREYLVIWADCPDEPSWEPQANLECPDKLEEYLHQRASIQRAAAVYPHSPPWATVLTMDLLTVAPALLTETICMMAGVQPSQVVAQFAFPPCETYSLACRCNINRCPPCHYRIPGDPTHPPRDDDSPYAAKAKLHDELVQRILGSWSSELRAGRDQLFWMENPVGDLATRDFMDPLTAQAAMGRHTVDYCAYGHPFQKPTHVWTSSAWSPRGATGTGRCGKECPQGFVGSKGCWRHPEGLGRGRKLLPKGPDRKKQVNSVPVSLQLEWLDALPDPVPGRDTIVDLCSGWGSLREAVVSRGYNYVGVDSEGDRSLRSNEGS